MLLAQVIGTVVAPVQVPELEGRTHLIVQPVSPKGERAGAHRVAIDSIGAGVGDRVLVVDEGNATRQILKDPSAGLRTIIVGFVDSVSIGNETVYDHRLPAQ